MPRWSAPAAIATCFLGGAAMVVAIDPTDSGAFSSPSCVVKLTTGLDCPGCGGTRAFYYLLRGNLPEAARHHALAVFAAPFLVWLSVAWAANLVFGKRLPAPRLTRRVVASVLAIWAGFSVLRHLPWAPFRDVYVGSPSTSGRRTRPGRSGRRSRAVPGCHRSSSGHSVSAAGRRPAGCRSGTAR